jgi:hypothetical protein
MQGLSIKIQNKRLGVGRCNDLSNREVGVILCVGLVQSGR